MTPQAPPTLAQFGLLVLMTAAFAVARQLRRLTRSNRHADEVFRACFTASPIGLARVDISRRIVDANDAFCSIVGRSSAELVGSRITDLHHPDDELYWDGVDWSATGGTAETEVRCRRPDGTIARLECTATLLTVDGKPDHFYIQVRDMTEARAAQAALAHHATHDPLTGLFNRTLYLDRVETALERATPTELVAIVMIDLDHFSHHNDTFGHERGDDLLRDVAVRLGSIVRAGDTLARLGGDEFALLCTRLPTELTALSMAGRAQGALAPKFTSVTGDHTVTASIGIAISDGSTSPGQLVADATVALHRAKALGRNTIETVDQTLRAAGLQRLQIEKSLRHALDHGGLRVEYQPIVDPTTDTTTGFEALVRWGRPGGALVAPDDFIPIAEECGLIGQIGTFVLDTACADLAQWQSRLAPGAPTPTVAVNVSARELDDPTFTDQVAAVLRRRSIRPGTLTLEITERVLLQDRHDTLATLDALKALGVRIVLDDFGTGYSGLAYLTTFPIDGIKLDRLFVNGLGLPRQAAIVRAVLSIADALGLDVTAEGVETHAQLEELRGLGCTSVQGYFISRPLPAELVAQSLVAAGLLASTTSSTDVEERAVGETEERWRSTSVGDPTMAC